MIAFCLQSYAFLLEAKACTLLFLISRQLLYRCASDGKCRAVVKCLQKAPLLEEGK